MYLHTQYVITNKNDEDGITGEESLREIENQDR